MKKFTKKQRHDIYVRALEILKSGALTSDCICYALDAATDDTPEVTCVDGAMEKFYPEIYKQRPEHGRSFWWPEGDIEPRINALETAIKQTE